MSIFRWSFPINGPGRKTQNRKWRRWYGIGDNFNLGSVVAFNTFKYFQIINIIRMNVFIFNIMLLIFFWLWYRWRPLEPNTKNCDPSLYESKFANLQTLCEYNPAKPFSKLIFYQRFFSDIYREFILISKLFELHIC